MGIDPSVILTRSKLLADRLRPLYFSYLPKDIFFTQQDKNLKI